MNFKKVIITDLSELPIAIKYNCNVSGKGAAIEISTTDTDNANNLINLRDCKFLGIGEHCIILQGYGAITGMEYYIELYK